MKKTLVMIFMLASICCHAQININIRYSASDNGAIKYMNEMISSGIADEIRAIPGCLKYDYLLPQDALDEVLLTDSWEDQAALDRYHSSEAMKKAEALREKYNIQRNVQMSGTGRPGGQQSSRIDITIHYSAPDNGAIKYMNEMNTSGLADKIRAIEGCIRYDYFIPQNAPDEVILMDSWEDSAALNRYHSSQVMKDAEALRAKYNIQRNAQMPGSPRQQGGRSLGPGQSNIR